MKKLIFLFVAAASFAATAAKLDGIAACVDSVAITIGDVMAEIRRNPDIAKRIVSGDDSELKALYKAALDNLIERRLILKAAADKSVEIPEWVIDNQLREIVHNSFGGDMNRLQEEMAKSKMPMSDYRNTVREDILVRGMRQQMIEQFVTASPAMMKKEYAEHPERYRQDAKVTVRVILLKPGKEGDGVPSLSTRWEQIGEELAMGQTFSDLAIKYSADSHAKDGGLWKDVNPAEAFRPEIAEAISSLDVGRVSRMINLDGWGFIVKKESETKARQMSFAEAYDDIAANVKEAAAKKAYDEWIARLKENAFVKIYPFEG
ncbi:MAG: SurA N-terminal domain-containing protein [Kiritimatiellae bacterium]|nr:SurA N-terminal domain-containing protein [Kiritimatiellia bacterium]